MCRLKEIEFLLKENIYIADYFRFVPQLIEILTSAWDEGRRLNYETFDICCKSNTKVCW